MRESNITNTMYRYEALIQAIGFFTQRFSLQQLSEYSFDFTNEILVLNASALFMLEDNEYKLKNQRLYKINNYTIKNNEKLQKIATLHGSVMLNNFNNYFEKKDIDHLNMAMVLPLIIDDLLIGFIVADGKAMGSFQEDDYIIAMSLMRLFNNSLENSKNFMDLKDKNKQLDEKIFNLFAINQSAKSLLAELGIDKLKKMAVDVFSEIACSKITSFGVVDDISGNLKILGYRNIDNFSTCLTEFHIKPSVVLDHNKIVLNIEKDMEIVKEIFVNWEEFHSLGAQYIVLLVRDKLIGLVTLGEPINQTHYHPSMFELIESLASFTYIALKNAMLFEEIQQQKQIIEAKFHILTKLNGLINNINQCISIEELCDVTLKTLNISFGIQKAFIAFKEENQYKILHSIDGIGVGLCFQLNNKWDETFDGDSVYDFAAEGMYDYLDEALCRSFHDATGIVIAPIKTCDFSFEDNTSPAAYLIILKTYSNLQPEEILLIDTIAKNISPIIYHMNALEEYKQDYVPNYKRLFHQSLCKKLEDKNKYHVDFNVYYSMIRKNPLDEVDVSIYEAYEHYLIENYLFIISYDDLDLKDFRKTPPIEEIEDILKYDFIE
ncbi:hypothetical protein SAMN05660297_02196 [Natronincola peptidivorans]|uniref:GAF domain-containing protein n=1 Tax=Natronincola peptidivorans TaxID=426128 RepID=A0A1I0DXT1_9FIRM|nr:GAF domain-containing protein [Natronincola peptidivorans]SET37344.1 hypothetical protein SAMN05660297_02196 [Natronincola peptidivorans]